MLKKAGITCSVIILIATSAFFAIYYWVSLSAKNSIYYELENLPNNQVGIVLGTSKYRVGGGINEFYKSRIDGAADLYHQGKVERLLVSGDNRLNNYNEPITMWHDLIKAGVPKDHIILDYAGFRTLDSIIRASKVFSIEQFTIITQKFHCERALFIAQHKNLNTICYAVKTPKSFLTTYFREAFARINSIYDLYIIDKQPKFLGPQISIFD